MFFVKLTFQSVSLGIFILLLIPTNAYLLSDSKLPIQNFRIAKRHLSKIYQDRQIDFYCGCRYNRVNFEGYSRLVLSSDCGVKPRKNEKRAKRIEYDHIVSAHAFGNTLTCWREPICHKKGKSFKGRKCCAKIDPKFYTMEGDMHNLFPAPGELNGDRNNFHFGLLPKQSPLYGSCYFKIDFEQRLVEPDPSIRGDIARTYFYMEDRYGVNISNKNRKLYEVWDKVDPPDEWEMERNIRIKKIQGNENPFITSWRERHI